MTPSKSGWRSSTKIDELWYSIDGIRNFESTSDMYKFDSIDD